MTFASSTRFDHALAPAMAIIARAKDITDMIEARLAPVLQLAIRLWIANLFFKSGMTKIADWPSTLFLFEFEYQVPILPTNVAAAMGTTFELTMPILLVLGLGARLAALPLLGMAMIIQFVLGAGNAAFDNVEHFYWMFMLAIIALRGAGPISLDYLLLTWIKTQRG